MKKPMEKGIKMNEETEMGFKREKMRASECPSNPFFSLSRMCFDVLSIKRQRHRKQRARLAAKSTVLAATAGRGGGKWREGEGRCDTVYCSSRGTET